MIPPNPNLNELGLICFCDNRTTFADIVEMQTLTMGIKAMAHEFKKSLMTTAPQGSWK